MSVEENMRYAEYMRSDKWRNIAAERMRIDGYTCAGCGCTGTAVNVLECHHLTYRHLYQEENWIYEDLVTLCHACHKNLHRIMERQTNKEGRRGWKDNPRIPQTHIYNLNGELEIKEDIAE